MSDYIKREDAIVAYANFEVDVRQGKFDDYRQYMRNVLRSVESVDAVPVVRCKDCKHHFYCCRGSIPVDDNGFCSAGERRDDDD